MCYLQIYRNMSVLNQHSQMSIPVALSVPATSEGTVRFVYFSYLLLSWICWINPHLSCCDVTIHGDVQLLFVYLFTYISMVWVKMNIFKHIVDLRRHFYLCFWCVTGIVCCCLVRVGSVTESSPFWKQICCHNLTCWYNI